MRVLLIGATGRTGSLVLKQLLARGDSVTALVRDPTKLKHNNALTIVKGSSMSASDVATAFTSERGSIDAVIVTLNLARDSHMPWAKVVGPSDLVEKSVANLKEAMKRHGVRRLVVMTAFGVGESFSQVPWYLKSLIEHSLLKTQFRDHNAAHRLVKNDKDIDWVFLRPVRLVEGPTKPIREYGDVGVGLPGMAAITIASVADALVDAAAGWKIGRTTVIAN